MKQYRFQGEPVSLLAVIVNLFVSLGGYIFGYDTGYISGCLIMPYFQSSYGTPDTTSASGFSLTPHRQSVVVALLSAGCFAGALLGAPSADFLGRRGAIFTVSAIFITGVVIQVAAEKNLGAFIGGRFVAGLGVGALSALVPLYQGEISPKALRGAFVSCYQLMITVGILIAYIVDFGCKDIKGTASYKIPIGIQVVWGLILCIGVPFLPRSPRESILHGHDENARIVISKMHGIPLDDPLVQAYMDEIAAKIEEEKHSGTTYLDCFDFKNELRSGQRTLIGCCVQSFTQLGGANFIFYYGTSIFNSVNPSLNSYISQIIFGVINMLGTLPGIYWLERFGRRRTMITGVTIAGLAYMLYAVIGSYALYPDNNPNNTPRKGPGGGMLFAICIFVLSYSSTFGPGMGEYRRDCTFAHQGEAIVIHQRV